MSALKRKWRSRTDRASGPALPGGVPQAKRHLAPPKASQAASARRCWDRYSRRLFSIRPKNLDPASKGYVWRWPLRGRKGRVAMASERAKGTLRGGPSAGEQGEGRGRGANSAACGGSSDAGASQTRFKCGTTLRHTGIDRLRRTAYSGAPNCRCKRPPPGAVCGGRSVRLPANRAAGGSCANFAPTHSP